MRLVSGCRCLHWGSATTMAGPILLFPFSCAPCSKANHRSGTAEANKAATFISSRAHASRPQGSSMPRLITDDTVRLLCEVRFQCISV